jgi:hypothetical protein
MSQTISGSPPYNAPYFYGQAMAGMKADSSNDNVDTFACGVTGIGFGVVCGRLSAGSMVVAPGGTAPLEVGITLHDHLIASRGGYTQYDAVSVLNRGRVWAVVDNVTGVQDGAAVYFTTSTGAVNTVNTNPALTNAVFRSAPASVFNMLGGTAVNVAVVELHYPLV